MYGLLNPFGVRNGELITVEDLDPKKDYGLKCECTCPNCEGAFQARCLREGSQRTKHFSHHNALNCDVNIAFLKSIYLLIKEYIDRRIQEKSVLFLPDIIIRFGLDDEVSAKNIRFIRSVQDNQTDVLVRKATATFFDRSEIRYDEKGFPQALVAIKGDHKLAFVVEPPEICSGRVKLKKYEDYATIQIGFLTDESIFSNNKKEQLLQLIDDKWEQIFWIYSPKWIDVKEDVYKRQTEYQEWKRQEQERKERERQARERQEQERRERERREKEPQKVNIPKMFFYPNSTEHDKESGEKRQGDSEKKKKLSIGKQKIRIELLRTQQPYRVSDGVGYNYYRLCSVCDVPKFDYSFSDNLTGTNCPSIGVCKDCFNKEKNI